MEEGDVECLCTAGFVGKYCERCLVQGLAMIYKLEKVLADENATMEDSVNGP